MTGLPEVAAASVHPRPFELLSSRLPLWLAEEVASETGEYARRLGRILPLPAGLRLLVRMRCRAALRRRGELEQGWGVAAWSGPKDAVAPAAKERAAAAELLAGRLLLEGEVLRLLEAEGGGRFEADPAELVEALVHEGRLHREAAVHRDAVGRWRCRRCGTRDRVDIGPCYRCGRDACASCTECARLGVARACEAVLYAPGPAVRAEGGADGLRSAEASGSTNGLADPPMARATDAPLLQLPFPLSPPQEAASRALIEGGSRNALVWAACGAGKTEVVYAAIEQALRRGESVLFAIPRRDVVVELEQRLKSAFPGVPVRAVYGGSPVRFPDVPLLVATTHQVMRFYQRFHLVVLDEIDAYPYWGSQMLRHAVSRATRPGGRQICLTATPPAALLERVERREWDRVTIPARHHGYPLPEPEILRVPGIERVQRELLAGQRRVELPQVIVETIQLAVRQPDPLLVFVPTVALVAPTARLLDTVVRAGARPEADALPLAFGIHSRDPRRDEVRQAFTRGEFPILVATTVLERGITVPGVNVIVLWADAERVFDTASLIQMAGRVGRTTERPHGRVWFIAASPNRAMSEAVERIRELNREAEASGYLRSS